MMRGALWACRMFIFLFLFAFALKNSDPVGVRFFFGSVWQAPLIVVVLAFFAGGAILGILSLLGVLFRLRRDLSVLRRDLQEARAAQDSVSGCVEETVPPRPDAPQVVLKT